MNIISTKYPTSILVIGIAACWLNIGVANSQVTFPSGSTITTGGKVYEPGELTPNQEREVENLIASGEESGVVGTNLFVQVEDEIVVVPIDEIKGKKKGEIVEIFKSRVVEILERNLEKNPEKASKGLQNALENQEQFPNNANRAAKKAERLSDKADRTADRAERLSNKAERAAERAAGAVGEAAEKAERAADRAAAAAERAAEKAERVAERAAAAAERAAEMTENAGPGAGGGRGPGSGRGPGGGKGPGGGNGRR